MVRRHDPLIQPHYPRRNQYGPIWAVGWLASHLTSSLFPFTFSLKFGAVLVSTGVVRLDKRVVAPDHDKTGTF